MSGEATEVSARFEETGQGDNLFFDTSWDRSRPSRPDAERWEGRFVLNGEYSALWLVGNSLAYIYDHKSTSNVHRMAQSWLGSERPFDWKNTAFGLGEKRLAEYVSMHEDVFVWDAEPYTGGDGRPLVVVRRHSPYVRAGDGVDIEVYLDPDRGYMVDCAIHRDHDGWLTLYTRAEYAEIAPGRFLPASASFRLLDPEAKVKEHDIMELLSGALLERIDPKSKVVFSDFSITKFEVRLPAAAEPFTWESLGIPPEIRVIREFLNGNTELYTSNKGTLVPVAVAAELSTETLLANSFDSVTANASSARGRDEGEPDPTTATVSDDGMNGMFVLAAIISIVAICGIGFLLMNRRRKPESHG